MAENLKSFCTKILVKLPQDQGKDLTFTLFSVEDLNDVRGEVRLGCLPSSLALGRDGNNQGSGQLIGDIITSSLRSVPRALIHHRHPGGTWFHSFLSLFFPCKKMCALVLFFGEQELCLQLSKPPVLSTSHQRSGMTYAGVLEHAQKVVEDGLSHTTSE